MQERGKYEKLYNEAVDGSISSNAKASDAQAKSLADVRMMCRFSLASRVRVHSFALVNFLTMEWMSDTSQDTAVLLYPECGCDVLSSWYDHAVVSHYQIFDDDDDRYTCEHEL